jgi:uncharacterized sulfatase
MRAMRTKEFLYIRNFAPDRWPMGAPNAVTASDAPSASDLEQNTPVAFPDMDAGPTKAWLVKHRNEPEGRIFYERAFGKRKAEELYDLRTDPGQMTNVASQDAYAAEKNAISNQLMRVLSDTRDPRVTDEISLFDKPPFTDPQSRGPLGALKPARKD